MSAVVASHPTDCPHCCWYRCGVCGEGCRDFPVFEHAGRCFPARPECVGQLVLEFGVSS